MFPRLGAILTKTALLEAEETLAELSEKEAVGPLRSGIPDLSAKSGPE